MGIYSTFSYFWWLTFFQFIVIVLSFVTVTTKCAARLRLHTACAFSAAFGAPCRRAAASRGIRTAAPHPSIVTMNGGMNAAGPAACADRSCGMA